jgi:C-terminal, D2-small domain, of ClpB protein
LAHGTWIFSNLRYIPIAALSNIKGARPLNRLIQKVILEPLAMELISGTIRPNEEVKIRVEGDNLVVIRNHEPTEDPNDLTPVDMGGKEVKEL